MKTCYILHTGNITVNHIVTHVYSTHDNTANRLATFPSTHIIIRSMFLYNLLTTKLLLCNVIAQPYAATTVWAPPSDGHCDSKWSSVNSGSALAGVLRCTIYHGLRILPAILHPSLIQTSELQWKFKIHWWELKEYTKEMLWSHLTTITYQFRKY